MLSLREIRTTGQCDGWHIKVSTKGNNGNPAEYKRLEINRVLRFLSTALAWAAEIAQNSSPDAVQSTKRALLLAQRHGSVEEAVIAHIHSKESKRAFVSENIQVGTERSNTER